MIDRMRLLVIGRKSHYESRRIAAAAATRGHEATVASFRDIRIATGSLPTFAVAGRDIFDFDVLHFRRFWPYVSEAVMIARAFRAAGKPVVDRAIAERPFVMSKTWESVTLEAAGVRVPKTVQCFDADGFKAAACEIGFPLVVKGIHGGLGAYVHLARDMKGLKRILARRNLGSYSLQEYLPARHDIRVIAIGGKAIGAMRRLAPPGDFRANVALGGRPLAEPLTPELADLTERSARALERDFAGVDILDHGGKRYVLEVNQTPGFKGFEAATGIDVADRFMRYLERLTVDKHGRRK